MPVSKFRYATLVRSEGHPELDEKGVHLVPGKQDQEVKTVRYIDDGHIKGFQQERVEVLELPRPMSQEEIVGWAEENRNEVFPEASQKGGDE